MVDTKHDSKDHENVGDMTEFQEILQRGKHFQ